jgi:hypothetical protein
VCVCVCVCVCVWGWSQKKRGRYDKGSVCYGVSTGEGSISPELNFRTNAVPIKIRKQFCRNFQIDLKIYLEVEKTKNRKGKILKAKGKAGGIRLWVSRIPSEATGRLCVLV